MMARNRSNLVKASLLFLFYFMESPAEVCLKKDDCTCLKSNGKVISLRRIDGGSQGPAFRHINASNPHQMYVYDWNPCTKFTEGDGCKDVLMCQAFPGTFKSYPCAATVADFKVNGDGTTCINYQPVNYEGYIRSVVIYLKCDESKFPGEMSSVTETYTSNSSIYNATLTSKCACDDGCISDDGKHF